MKIINFTAFKKKKKERERERGKKISDFLLLLFLILKINNFLSSFDVNIV